MGEKGFQSSMRSLSVLVAIFILRICEIYLIKSSRPIKFEKNAGQVHNLLPKMEWGWRWWTSVIIIDLEICVHVNYFNLIGSTACCAGVVEIMRLWTTCRREGGGRLWTWFKIGTSVHRNESIDRKFVKRHTRLASNSRYCYWGKINRKDRVIWQFIEANFQCELMAFEARCEIYQNLW